MKPDRTETTRQRSATEIALLNAIIVSVAVLLLAFVALFLTPVGPDSPAILPFILVVWGSAAASLATGLAYVAVRLLNR